MTRRTLIIAALIAFSCLGGMAQNRNACTYIVKEASFENTKGLTPEQVQKLQALVVGRCYDPANAVFFSQYVYDQLREWGYCKAKVYDPNNFHVLDMSVHPSPIAVVVDFRLTESDAERK